MGMMLHVYFRLENKPIRSLPPRFLGVFTGLLVSYIMKVYETFVFPPLVWIAATAIVFVGYLVILILIWYLTPEH